MKKRIVIILLFQILCLGLLSEYTGFAASPLHSDRNLSTLGCGYNPQIDLAPALPAATDAISITASGIWPDSCIPKYQSHQVMNGRITIGGVVTGTPGTVCLFVIMPWEFTVGLGTLVTGSYQVDLYITDYRYTQTPVLCTTASFTVFDQSYKDYLPIITK